MNTKDLQTKVFIVVKSVPWKMNKAVQPSSEAGCFGNGESLVTVG
jgi:hypothetical protein